MKPLRYDGCNRTRQLRPSPCGSSIDYETAQGRQVYDIHNKSTPALGCFITSLDLNSGELRLIEVKRIGDAIGTVLRTPNERRVAKDRRDCYWLYVVGRLRHRTAASDPDQGNSPPLMA